MKNKRYRISFWLCLFFLSFLYPSRSANAVCFGGNGSYIDDLAVFASKWLDTCSGPNWCLGVDADQNQLVNFEDYSIVFGGVKPLVLFENGICNVSIRNVVQGVISSTEAYATNQLQDAFYCATGVHPAINPSTPAEIEIKLGLAARFNSEIGNSSDQAYAIRRTLDGDIELVGNSTAAILWAVTDFAESVLHVTWPIADDNMVLEGAQQSRIIFDQTCREEAPDFIQRGWILGENIDGMGYTNEIDNWMSHNRQNFTIISYPYLDSSHYNSPYARLIERPAIESQQ